MWFGIVSLFPEMFGAVTESGVTGRAVKKGLIEVDFWNPRDFTHDVHRTVDDRPFGGGPGMVMKVEPLLAALTAAKTQAGSKARTIFLSPQGRQLNQQGVFELVMAEKLILVCGRYEGIDERIIETEIDEEWSVGDFVLSGGELAAMCLFDAVSRQVPGVLGHEGSAEQDSFMNGLLDCPHYTRPEIFKGHTVPQVLLSGHHENIRRWRLKQSLGRTWLRRPDLLQQRELNKLEQTLLHEFMREHSAARDSGAENEQQK